MAGMMIGYEEALAATLAACTPLRPAELAPLWELCGRVTAQDLIALDDSPTADVSLKDGYAVQSADVAQAAPDHPVPLRLIGQAAAGGTFAGQVAPGATVRILSGAPLPAGATAVLAEEFAVRAGECITALADAAPGRNVMRRGSELARGQCMVPAGTVLRPAQVGLLAAAGYCEAPVVRRPQVGIVATGDEVVGLGLPAAAPGNLSPHESLRLEAGQVFASNLATLIAWCRHYGMGTTGAVVADDQAALRAALLDALAQNDAVITSGGAWSGEHDLVAGVLEELGWRKVYHRVRLGPGKGVGFGLWQGKPVFVLPGGPPSSQMAFLQLALPGLHRLMGYPHPGLPTRPARLAAAVSGQQDWTQFIEGRFAWDAAGLLFVPGKGQSRLRAMAACEGYVKIPEGIELLEEGALVAVQVLPGVPALLEASPALRPASASRVSPASAAVASGGAPPPSPAVTERDGAQPCALRADATRGPAAGGWGEPLIVSMVARSGMGKTTFLEKLLPELKALGLRVGVLKHHAHATPFDVPGKDTFRMSEAGAELVVGVCAVQTAVFISGDASTDLEGVIRRHFGGMDVVITEGYKRGAYPKIEIHRAARAAEDRRYAELLCSPEELLLVVTDVALPLPPMVPQFGLDDAHGVARFLAGLAAARPGATAPTCEPAAGQG